MLAGRPARRIVEVETADQLKAAIGPKTAMLYWVNISEPKGKISAKEFLEAGKRAGVPVFNDAAAELPPADNLNLTGEAGVRSCRLQRRERDCTGRSRRVCCWGARDLIEAAHMNNNPNSDTIARTAKVGKEEIMGLLAAVEVYVKRDHAADQKLWQSMMQNVARDLKRIRAVTAEVYVPAYPGAHPVPYLRVKWDKSLPISYQECAKQLRDGEPRIEVNASAEEITLASYMLNPGEERIVGWRLAEVLGGASSACRPHRFCGDVLEFESRRIHRGGSGRIDQDDLRRYGLVGRSRARRCLSRSGFSGARGRCLN